MLRKKDENYIKTVERKGLKNTGIANLIRYKCFIGHA